MRAHLVTTYRDWAHMKGQRPPATRAVVPGAASSAAMFSSVT